MSLAVVGVACVGVRVNECECECVAVLTWHGVAWQFVCGRSGRCKADAGDGWTVGRLRGRGRRRVVLVDALTDAHEESLRSGSESLGDTRRGIDEDVTMAWPLLRGRAWPLAVRVCLRFTTKTGGGS